MLGSLQSKTFSSQESRDPYRDPPIVDYIQLWTTSNSCSHLILLFRYFQSHHFLLPWGGCTHVRSSVRPDIIHIFSFHSLDTFPRSRLNLRLMYRVKYHTQFMQEIDCIGERGAGARNHDVDPLFSSEHTTQQVSRQHYGEANRWGVVGSAFSNYLSMTWVNIVESILHYMCVAVFVVEEVVLSICRCGSVGSESSKRGAARDSNSTVA
jgi:hypothetical protein